MMREQTWHIPDCKIEMSDLKNYYYHLVDFTVKRKILEENLPNDSNCYLFEHLNNIYLSVKLIFMVFIEILSLWGKNSFNSKIQ